MPRVSAECIFRSYWPDATIRAHHRGNRADGARYYLVRTELTAHTSAGSGSTRAKAWADACTNRGYTALKGA